MLKQEYRTFSSKTHGTSLGIQQASSCQFEITFCCAFHCRHCYTDCYNTAARQRKELSTQKICALLDRLHAAGVVWLCLTGGDPLCRKDFLEIYAFAKKKGFLVTIFTSAASINKTIVSYFRKSPPFVVEVTVPAATKKTHEFITQIPGSLQRQMRGIGLLRQAKIPLRIKTLITGDNRGEITQLRKKVTAWGLKLTVDLDICARLNGDQFPCTLRLPEHDAWWRKGNAPLTGSLQCHSSSERREVFPCAVSSGDGFWIDPCGKMFLCQLIRDPSYSLLHHSIEKAFEKNRAFFADATYKTDSLCKSCFIRGECFSCPGKALLETGDKEAPIPYYCRIATLRKKGKRT